MGQYILIVGKQKQRHITNITVFSQEMKNVESEVFRDSVSILSGFLLFLLW